MHTESLDTMNAIEIRWKCLVPEFMRTMDIYRSDNYDKDYRRLGSVGPQDTAFIDRQVNPVQTYFYYLIINNAYGQSIPSARITGMLNANRKAQPPLELKAEAKKGIVFLNWKRPTADTRGYYVYRSEMNIGDSLTQLTDIILSDSLEVIYTDSLKGVNSLSLAYAVKSVNTSYDISPFSEVVYVTPNLNVRLTTPIGLRTRFSDGHVLVTWTDERENDRNIVGYNLYRKFLKVDGTDSTSFILINGKSTDNSLNYFDDSTVVEGKTYLYSVESFSVADNKSPMSAPAQIEIPVYKPVSISSLKVARIKNGVTIEWNKTMQPDVKEYRIYRLTKTGSPVMVAKLKPDAESYLDKTAPKDESCFYAITCVNNDNIESSIEDWVGAEE